MKVFSKFGMVGFAVSTLVCAFCAWSAVYTVSPETRVKAIFNAVVPGTETPIPPFELAHEEEMVNEEPGETAFGAALRKAGLA